MKLGNRLVLWLVARLKADLPQENQISETT